MFLFFLAVYLTPLPLLLKYWGDRCALSHLVLWWPGLRTLTFKHAKQALCHQRYTTSFFFSFIPPFQNDQSLAVVYIYCRSNESIVNHLPIPDKMQKTELFGPLDLVWLQPHGPGWSFLRTLQLSELSYHKQFCVSLKVLFTQPNYGTEVQWPFRFSSLLTLGCPLLKYLQRVRHSHSSPDLFWQMSPLICGTSEFPLCSVLRTGG